MEDNQPENVLAYRVGVLETQYLEILTLVRQTHDAVTIIQAKMGNEPFRCGLHDQKMEALENRMKDFREQIEAKNLDMEKLKSYMYRGIGALGIVSIIFSCFVSPFILDAIRKTIH